MALGGGSPQGGITATNDTYNFVLKRGATFQKIITWRDNIGNVINLENAHARMHVKSTDGSLSVDLSDANSQITFNAPYGQLILEIPWQETMLLDPKQHYIYDLFVFKPDGTQICILEGTMTVTANVTDITPPS